MVSHPHKTIVAVPPVPLITIFVRHSANCSHRDDYFYKRCNCRKSLRFFHNGKQRMQSAKTRSWGLAEEAKRKLEDQFRAADPTRPIATVSVEATTRPTIEKAIELFLTDKLTQGLDPTAHTKHVRELGRLKDFMAKRGRFFPHEVGLSDLTEFRATWVHHYSSCHVYWLPL